MKVKDISNLFQNELKGNYPHTEIGTFVYFTLQGVLGFSRTDIVLRKEDEIDEKKLPIIIDVLEKPSTPCKVNEQESLSRYGDSCLLIHFEKEFEMSLTSCQ